MGADIIETLWAMGVPSSDMTDLSEVRPFRISSVGERLMLRAAMEQQFEISAEGIVENPWGFPYIPLPVKRTVSASGQIIAPDTISFEGLGHPIFWIDPELTARTEIERAQPERWAIRMFYLIMALGMWDPETLRWYNVPRSQGVEYTHDDWAAYRQGMSSALDTVRPLGVDDLLQSLGAVAAQTSRALNECERLQSEAWAKYRAELSAAYTTAVASTQESNEWREIDDRIARLTTSIAESLEGGVIPSSRVPEVYQCIDDLERVVKHVERSAIILSIPALSSSSMSDRIAAAATALKAAEADVDVDVAMVRTEAQRLFELSVRSSPQDFVRLHKTATEVYMKAWRTLILSARNLIQASRGSTVYSSWEAFELVEQTNALTWPPLTEVLAGIEG